MYIDGLTYACGTGRQKKWARETLIMECLYNTKPENIQYLKVKDVTLLRNYDDKDDTYFKYSFGYQFRFPQTRINILVNIKNGQMRLERDGLGYGWDEVEKEVYKFIERQIKLKNIYLRTSFNGEEFLIK